MVLYKWYLLFGSFWGSGKGRETRRRVQTARAAKVVKQKSQTAGRIQKLDPFTGVPIQYPLVVGVPVKGIYFLDPSGRLGKLH